MILPALDAQSVSKGESQLRGEGLLAFGLPLPGEEFVQPGLRLLGDAGEDVGEPGLGIDAVELGGADEGVHHRRPLAAAIGAREEPGLRPSAMPRSARSAALCRYRHNAAHADNRIMPRSGRNSLIHLTGGLDLAA